MNRLILLTAIVFATTVDGCGYFSNAVFFEGEGIVAGYVMVDGAPVEGALVFVLGESETHLTTGPRGSFSLRAHAGRSLSLVSMWGTNRGLKQKFDLAGDGWLDLGDVELKALGQMQGSVDLPNPGEAEVRVEGTPFVARPDGRGFFQLTLPGGSWDLVVSAPGKEDVLVDDVTVEPGGSGQVGTSTPKTDPDYTCEVSETRVERFSQGGGGAVDILFLVDNSGSMVGEQMALGYSFLQFVQSLDYGGVDYRIAVLTTGMESADCPPCTGSVTNSCINPTGENGRFQDRIGKNQGTEDIPDFVFTDAPDCRVVDQSNLGCFYDQVKDDGTVFVGINGCGYERGLAAMRQALESGMRGTYNAGFLRPAARLAVIVVSDEEDCGEVGDVYEMTSDRGNICYFASKGVGPDPENPDYTPMAYHPQDPERREYRLTPVEEYYRFLLDLKGGQKGLVKFAAIVGVKDANDPTSTTIEYNWGTHNRWEIVDACTTPGCTGDSCFAEPGTRYIQMAQLTGGIVESICRTDFSEPMLRISGANTGYVRSFPLHADPTSPDTIAVSINGVEKRLGWAWDPAKRAVVFEEAAAPPPYSLVRISYETACR